MEVSNASAVSEESVRTARLTALLDKLLPFAYAAEAVARRLVGKVNSLALVGSAAAAWIIFACRLRFELSAAVLLPVAALVLAAPLVLFKLATTLRSIVGLPQMLAKNVDRIIGKTREYRELAANRDQNEQSKPTLRSLWTTGRALLEVKGLTDESKEMVALAGKALVISNPLFAILLAVMSAATVIVIMIGVGIAFTFL